MSGQFVAGFDKEWVDPVPIAERFGCEILPTTPAGQDFISFEGEDTEENWTKLYELVRVIQVVKINAQIGRFPND